MGTFCECIHGDVLDVQQHFDVVVRGNVTAVVAAENTHVNLRVASQRLAECHGGASFGQH